MSTEHGGYRERKDVAYQNVLVDITPDFHQRETEGSLLYKLKLSIKSWGWSLLLACVSATFYPIGGLTSTCNQRNKMFVRIIIQWFSLSLSLYKQSKELKPKERLHKQNGTLI